jgi:hypothetical protein
MSARLLEFHVRVYMPDGSRGTFVGIFRHSMEAVLQALADFPEARCISARRLQGRG